MQKEAPSVKISAYCSEANKKVTYILSVEEGLSLKCKKCGRSAIIASPNHVYCGVCHRPLKEEYGYDGYILKCYNCGGIIRGEMYSSEHVLPINISKKYYCGECREELELGEKVSVISALCIYCGRKRYCVGEKIMDVFSAFCKSCGKETDWIETDKAVMCLLCGSVLGK